jgi:hypothetical protein
MKISNSLAKELKISSAASEKKINEMIKSASDAAEQKQTKEAVAGLVAAVQALKEHRDIVMAELERINIMMQIEPSYDVQIVRGSDGLAESFVMNPVRVGGVH